MPPTCRSPCGERGLKCHILLATLCRLESLPVRGAWIEIISTNWIWARCYCRSPCGERGLKSVCPIWKQLWPSRSPCGERGLKFRKQLQSPISVFRRSPCGERGLKCSTHGNILQQRCRSPCGERGLKYPMQLDARHREKSLPVRGAWIEIDYQDHETASETVAPRAGSVD